MVELATLEPRVSNWLGEFVPIPTLPVLVIRIRSVGRAAASAVAKIKCPEATPALFAKMLPLIAAHTSLLTPDDQVISPPFPTVLEAA